MRAKKQGKKGGEKVLSRESSYESRKVVSDKKGSQRTLLTERRRWGEGEGGPERGGKSGLFTKVKKMAVQPKI